MKTLSFLLLASLVYSPVSKAAPIGNPLVEVGFPIPFDRIRAEHIEPAIRYLLDEARKKRDAFVGDTSPRTFENTMLAYEAITADLNRVMRLVRHLEAVSSSPELRKALDAVLPAYTDFTSGLLLDKEVYARILEYSRTEEARLLDGPRKRFLEITLDEFRRSGVELDEARQRRLREINVELSRLRKQYADNVLDATNAFELVVTDPSKLAGLPPSAIAAARESARQKGIDGWRFTLHQPSYTAVMTYLDDGSIREKMFRAYNSRAAEINRPIILKILQLRRERASLLGFRNFADLIAADRMARNSDTIRAFLKTLEERTRPFYEMENAELLEFRRSLEGPNAPAPAIWDLAYYAEKLRKARYDFDEELLKPYFPIGSVFRGMFEIASRLFGIRIEKRDGIPVWDPAVEFFEVRDADGTLLGGFYTDFFPRENKRAGAWSSGLIEGVPSNGRFEPSYGAIHGNMSPPLGSQPALLLHREVQTVFHEFGHQLHHILSRAPVRKLREVAWDFVELPSQIMENWTWERQALDLFARHYQTGESIPDDLLQKMIRARNFRAANAQMRQLALATVDLALHIDYDPARDGDVYEYARNIFRRFTPAPVPDDYAMIASFTHIFSGNYACGYYSYKWAEVLDADAFTRFEKEGIFNRETGLAYRRQILEPGNSAPPEILFRNFIGRDPDPEALFRRLGLVRP